jgi:hypothetical protein
MNNLSAFITEHLFWFILICLFLAGIILFLSLLYYGFSNPPTEEEKNRHHPGDDLLANEPNRIRGTLAITVNAPREKVWPYLAQIGLRRAGFYSFGWLERLFGFHIYNTYTIVDEWQNIKPGDYIFYHQCGIGSEVMEVIPGKYFTSLSDSRNPSGYQGAIAFVPPFRLRFFAWTWSFILEDIGNNKTRFFTRCDAVYEPAIGVRKWLVAVFLGIPSFVMCKSMLKKIKACAEGRNNNP